MNDVQCDNLILGSINDKENALLQVLSPLCLTSINNANKCKCYSKKSYYYFIKSRDVHQHQSSLKIVSLAVHIYMVHAICRVLIGLKPKEGQ